jgi:hypothetical protein
MDITDMRRIVARPMDTMARSGLAAEPSSGPARGSGAAMATMDAAMGMAIVTMIVVVAMDAAMRMAEEIGIAVAIMTAAGIMIAANTEAISVAMTTDASMAEVTAGGSLLA